MGFTLNQLEQERQIRKLQKKEDKDTSDYEQLSNLPKINNVELKGDKTTSDLGINADNVMLSDGVTSVEDALDRITANTTDSVINISAYDSDTNYYICPHDGYVKVEADGASGNRTASYIVGMNTTLLMARVTNANVSVTNTVFVRKGTKVYITRSETIYSGAYFVPLI